MEKKLNKEKFDEEYNKFERDFYRLLLDAHFNYDSSVVAGVLSVGLLDYITKHIRDKDLLEFWKEDFDEYFEQLLLETQRIPDVNEGTK